MITGVVKQRSSLEPTFETVRLTPSSLSWGGVFVTAGVALAGAVIASGTTTSVPTSQVRYVDSGTSAPPIAEPGIRHVEVGRAVKLAVSDARGPVDRSAVGSNSGEGKSGAGEATAIRWLKEETGLTWDQLGRIFGVSRRAVHLWANGGRMNAGNAETLYDLMSVVRSLPGENSDERRMALLALDKDGRSIVDSYRTRRASEVDEVSGTPMAPDQFLGALHGDVAE